MPSEDEIIRLVYEQEGLEGVDKAIKAHEELAKAIESGVNPIQEAKAAAIDLAGKLDQLAQASDLAKEKQRELNEAYLAGTIAEGEYLDKTNALNAARRHLSSMVGQLTPKIEEAAGMGGGGLARLAINAERAGLALGTGSGLMRAGPMIESLTLALGGPAGLGLAIGAVAIALERIFPKISKWFDLWDEEKLKRIADHVKDMATELDKSLKTPTLEKEEAAKATKDFIKESGTAEIAEGIRRSLDLEQFGKEQLAAAEKRALETRKDQAASQAIGPTGAIVTTPGVTVEQAEKKLREIQETRAGEILAELPTGATAQGTVRRMAEARPGLFPKEFGQGLGELTPEAQEADKQAMKKLDEDEAERVGKKEARREMYRRQAEQRKRTEAKQKQEDSEIIEAAAEEERAKAEQDRTDQQVAVMTRQAEERQKREAEKAAREAARISKEKARADDPSTQLRAQEEARRDAAITEAERQNQAGGYGASPDQIASIAREAAKFPGDLTQNVDFAFGQAMLQLQRQNQAMQELNAKMNGWGNAFQGMNPVMPTTLPRGQ